VVENIRHYCFSTPKLVNLSLCFNRSGLQRNRLFKDQSAILRYQHLKQPGLCQQQSGLFEEWQIRVTWYEIVLM
jgi:hypothetical protein